MAKKKAEKRLDELLEKALVKEDEQPYDVLGNWEFVRLGEVVQINPPKIRPEISDDKLCSFVPMKAVSDRLGIIENIEMKPFGKVKSGYTSFKENDVLFAKITPCMENGKVAIAKNLIDGFGYGTTEFFVLRCSNIVSNKFLYYIVRSQAFRDSAQPNMTGTVGQRRVPKTYLYNYKFPFPPLQEQKRIVKKLSSMLGKLKDARELIREAKDTFEERRAAILNKAFTGELTKKWRVETPNVESAEKLIEILITEKKKQGEKGGIPTYEEMIIEESEQPYEVPRSWVWTRPTSLAEQLRGVSYKKKDAGRQPEEGKSLILRAGNLQEGEFITDHDCVYVANDLISNIQQLIVGDVVVASSSGSKSIVGKAAQVKKAMPSTSFGAFLTLCRPNTIINSKYYGWFFQSKYYRDKISMLSAGININNIKREHFESLYFPLPPLPEQKKNRANP